jgi:hypothetical protein
MLNADPSKVSSRAKKRGLPQLGTLGAGNHYCIAAGTYVNLSNQISIPIEEVIVGQKVMSVTSSDGITGVTPSNVIATANNGMKECIELLFSNGQTLTCTPDHRIMLSEGSWWEANHLIVKEGNNEGSFVMVGEQFPPLKSVSPSPSKQPFGTVGDNSLIGCFQAQLIGKKNVGIKQVYDISVDAESKSFMANGVIVHNCEIQIVEEIYDKAAASKMGIEFEGQVCIMVHSGSRGLGHQVATDALTEMERAMARDGIHTNDKQLACARINSKEGQDYLSAMAAAANYAWVNRSSMTFLVRQAFSKMFNTTPDDLDMHVVRMKLRELIE